MNAEMHECRNVGSATEAFNARTHTVSVHPMRNYRRPRRGEARARALQLLRNVRIPEPERRLGQYPHELSGGMRQRVVIAMAMACEPRLLIADEPTTALDVTIQAEILALIDRLKRENGMAVLFITHDMAVVAQMADRVVVMYRGKIVEEGPVAQIFENPRHDYTKMLLAASLNRSASSRFSTGTLLSG